MLYRVFPQLPAAAPSEWGGPLYVARVRQGVGRHDNPLHYGALYMSRSPESAVAESIQKFRGQTLTDGDLELVDGRRYALAAIDDGALANASLPVVDLDEPRELVQRDLRPSGVATRHRERTQPTALAIFDEGAAGIGWWSTLEASWPNVTLFAPRVLEHLSLAGPPEPLSVRHPALIAAADLLGLRLSARAR